MDTTVPHVTVYKIARVLPCELIGKHTISLNLTTDAVPTLSKKEAKNGPMLNRKRKFYKKNEKCNLNEGPQRKKSSESSTKLAN